MASWLDRVASIVKAKGPELYSSLLTASFEAREPGIQFSDSDKRQGRALASTLREAATNGDWISLRKPVGRTALISAAQIVTASADVEWAVVGLGTGTERGRSFVRQIYAKRGKESSVTLPTSLLSEIRGHLEAEEGAEFVHIHNHPTNARRLIKNVLVGENPLASWADRRFHLEYELFLQQVNRDAIRPRQVRCFLIENGAVRRYKLPAAPELIVTSIHDLKRRGFVKIDVREVAAALSDLGFRADPDLVERMLRQG